MIHFLYGDNDFLIDRYVEQVRTDFLHRHRDGSVVQIDVGNVAPAVIMAQLTAVSLFTMNQLIIIKAFTSIADNWTLLEKNIDYIPETTEVILTDIKSLSKVKNLAITKTFKKLKASGADIRKMELIKPWKMGEWLADVVKDRNLPIDKNAQRKLLELTSGSDNQQARLATELDKLGSLAETITVNVVAKYVEPDINANAFAILEMAILGDSSGAMAMLKQLQLSGEDSNRFMGLLASQLLALTAAITGAKLKINPYQLSQAQKLASQLGNSNAQISKLKRISTRLAELDEQIKLSTPEDAWSRIEIALACI